MTRETLELAIPAGSPIVADTSTVIAYLDGTEAASPAAAVVWDEFVRTGRNPAVISAISVTESLVRPIQAGSSATTIVEDFLQHFPNLTTQPFDGPIAREAARIRAVTGMKTPDAIVVATAVVAGIRCLVANDERWSPAIAKAAPGVSLCHLEGHLPL